MPLLCAHCSRSPSSPSELLPRNSSEDEGGRQAGRQARLHTKSHVRFEGEGRYGASRERVSERQGGLLMRNEELCPVVLLAIRPFAFHPPSPSLLLSLCPASTSHDSHPIFDKSQKSKLRRLRRPAMSEVPTAAPPSSPPPLLFFASSPQGENAANLHTSLTQAGNESWIPVAVYLALPSGPAVRRVSCFPPLAAGGEETGNSIAAVSIGNPDRVFGHGRHADVCMGRATGKAADRPTDLRCRKMFQKSVTKWDWMGTVA